MNKIAKEHKMNYALVWQRDELEMHGTRKLNTKSERATKREINAKREIQRKINENTRTLAHKEHDEISLAVKWSEHEKAKQKQTKQKPNFSKDNSSSVRIRFSCIRFESWPWLNLWLFLDWMHSLLLSMKIIIELYEQIHFVSLRWNRSQNHVIKFMFLFCILKMNNFRWCFYFIYFVSL